MDAPPQSESTRRRTRAAGRGAPGFLALELDAGPKAPPQYRQLYNYIRGLILSGKLVPGVRLPATRVLARSHGLARGTVALAYDQLLSEGYLQTARGSGTFVSRELPDPMLTVGHEKGAAPPAAGAPRVRPALSRRGAGLVALSRDRAPTPSTAANRAFTPGLPDLEAFPYPLWGRLLGRVWRRPARADLSHGDPAGQRALRAAIAAHLRAARGLACDWRQVIVTSGAQQALDLVVRALLDPGDAVWCEDPGYLGLRGPLVAAGARIVPVPVDGEGLSVSDGRRQAAGARLAVVAPSHQYPLGTVMSLARRMELLEWARAGEAWILEDDYDSEYRYAGRPLAALQGLDAVSGAGAGRVLYVGTFSKVLFPSLRLGYLVVPADLAEPIARVRAAVDDHPGSVVQAALAAFIAEGHFAAHIRRMRGRYAARQTALVAAVRRHAAGLLAVEPHEAGMHVVASLESDLAAAGDRAAAHRLAAAGLTAPALSTFFMGRARAQGLLLGYAALREEEIDAAVARMAAVLPG